MKKPQRLATEYQNTIDWTAVANESTLSAMDSEADTNFLEGELFETKTAFDALNRPTTMTLPDDTVIRPKYNEASLLDAVDAQLRGDSSWTDFVTDINYDAKGQREKIAYANGAQTKYTYDPYTFRLTRLLTTRNSGSDILQDLNYTFDAVGNIVEMQDDAQQTHYFSNTVVSPNAKYSYDALYRILLASGREHAGNGQITHAGMPYNTPVPHVNNSSAVETYTEQYQYDALGNILKLIHQASSGNWTRGYHYDTATNNYLLKSSLNGDDPDDHQTFSASYTHDVHGNMTSMPHLSSMNWDYMDQLKEVDLGGGGTAYYVYSGGDRVRKVIVNGSLVKERIYLGGYEIYREYQSGTLDKERESIHIMDDQRRIALVETLTVDNGGAVGSPTPVIKYQLGNHLDSASLELDDAANVISYEEYHPFGTSAYRLGTTSAEVSLKRYRYVGKEHDDETGLYYYGARYYCPWLCRFISVDPLKDKYPFYTTYQYAGNKPITSIDRDGMEAENQVEPVNTGQQAPPASQVILAQGENYLIVPESASVTYENECGRACGFTIDGESYVYDAKSNSFKTETGQEYDNKLIFESKVSDQFKSEVLKIAYNLKVDPNNLMAVMAFETGETFSPSIQNAAGAEAYGLIQFMNVALKDINQSFDTDYSLDEVKKMTAIEQLDLVEKQFKMWQDRGKSLTDVSDFYMAVFSPKYIGKDESTSMYEYKFDMVADTTVNSETGDTLITQKEKPVLRSAYWQNRGLDTNKDKKITKGEAAAKVRAKLIRGTQFYNK